MSAVDRAGLAEALSDYGVPENLRDGLELYLCEHIPPGHFLRAVLSNDLLEAINRADPISRHALPDLVGFLANVAPAAAWGSRERVRIWLEARPHR